MADNIYEGIERIVYINTNISTGCKECNTLIKGEDFDDAVNHYLQKHNYKLLHVGSEDSGTIDVDKYTYTVAVLGK